MLAQCIDFTVEGTGVVRQDNKVVFVPGLVPGDKAEISITADKKNYLLGKLDKIIEPSPDRVGPHCKHFGICGGCTLQHYTYAAQLRWKENFIKQSLQRIAGLDTLPLKQIVPSEQIWEYRNKAGLPFGQNYTLGFFKPDSHSVVNLQECPIQHPDFIRIIAAVRKFAEKNKIPIYSEKTHKGILRHLIIRKSDYMKEILLGLVVNCQNFGLRDKIKQLVLELNKELQTYKIVSVVANINRKKTNKILADKQDIILGSGFVTEKIGKYLFKVSLNTFLQVNTPQAEKAYEQIKKWCAARSVSGVEPPSQEKAGKVMPDILDAYCGIGTIALSAADSAAQVLGIEEVAQSIKDAKRNAENNGLKNVRFLCGRAEEQSIETLGRPDVVIVDPPRKGLAAEMINKILEISPEKIIYLSCNPASLARDLKLLLQGREYKLQEVIPYDFFPQTTHVETLVLLQR